MHLQLESVKQILDQLVFKEQLKPGQKNFIEEGIKAGELKGFSGKLAVEKGWVSQENLNTALREQAFSKALASINDMESIADNYKAQPPKKLEIPSWLRVNLGNNGVNPASKRPTLIDGAAAAANVAQSMVLLASRAPQLAAEMQEPIRSAAALALYLGGTFTENVPVAELQEWQQLASDGLKRLAAYYETSETLRNTLLQDEPVQDPDPSKPRKPSPQKVPTGAQIAEYLEQRNAEISGAIILTGPVPWQQRMEDLGTSGKPGQSR